MNGEEPKLYRKRKVSSKLNFNRSSTTYFPSNAKEQYHYVYFSAYDATVKSAKERFNQENFKKYTSLQELFLKVVKGELWADEMEAFIASYKEAFSRFQLDKRQENKSFDASSHSQRTTRQH